MHFPLKHIVETPSFNCLPSIRDKQCNLAVCVGALFMRWSSTFHRSNAFFSLPFYAAVSVGNKASPGLAHVLFSIDMQQIERRPLVRICPLCFGVSFVRRLSFLDVVVYSNAAASRVKFSRFHRTRRWDWCGNEVHLKNQEV